MAKLFTGKQRKFIDEYLQCLNATQAAIRAGYAESSAYQRGYELVNDSEISAEIERRFQSALGADEVLYRLAAQARGDMGDFIDPATLTVSLKQARELGITHLIRKIKQTTITKDDEQFETFEFELYDAQKALALLGKYHKLFTDVVRVEAWQDRAIEDIKAGRIQYADLADAFDHDLATQLFQRAGVPVEIDR
jgi:phage terminase small subunit